MGHLMPPFMDLHWFVFCSPWGLEFLDNHFKTIETAESFSSILFALCRALASNSHPPKKKSSQWRSMIIGWDTGLFLRKYFDIRKRSFPLRLNIKPQSSSIKENLFSFLKFDCQKLDFKGSPLIKETPGLTIQFFTYGATLKWDLHVQLQNLKNWCCFVFDF